MGCVYVLGILPSPLLKYSMFLFVVANLWFNKYARGDAAPVLMNKNSPGGVSQAHPAPVQMSVSAARHEGAC